MVDLRAQLGPLPLLLERAARPEPQMQHADLAVERQDEHGERCDPQPEDDVRRLPERPAELGRCALGSRDGDGDERGVPNERHPAGAARPRQARARRRRRAAGELRAEDERERAEERGRSPRRPCQAGEEPGRDGQLERRNGDSDGSAGRHEAVPVERGPPRPEARDLRDRGDGKKRTQKRRERDGDHGHPATKARSRTGRTGSGLQRGLDARQRGVEAEAVSSISASEITSGGASMSASMCSVPTGVGHE